MISYYDTIIDTDRFVPTIIQDLSYNEATKSDRTLDLPGSVSFIRSDYVRRIRNCIMMRELHRPKSSNENRYELRRYNAKYSTQVLRYNISIGGSEFIVTDGFIYHVQSSKIIFLTVYDTQQDRHIGFVDREFDSVRVPIQLANMRKHIRAGLRLGREAGLSYQHVPSAFFTQFKMSFNYNGKENLVRRAHTDARKSLLTLRM